MAPPAHRGAINMLFQLATTIGILAAQASIPPPALWCIMLSIGVHCH